MPSQNTTVIERDYRVLSLDEDTPRLMLSWSRHVARAVTISHRRRDGLSIADDDELEPSVRRPQHSPPSSLSNLPTMTDTLFRYSDVLVRSIIREQRQLIQAAFPWCRQSGRAHRPALPDGDLAQQAASSPIISIVSTV